MHPSYRDAAGAVCKVLYLGSKTIYTMWLIYCQSHDAEGRHCASQYETSICMRRCEQKEF